MSADAQKQQVALEAVKHAQSGMTLGLGTGSTANYVIHALGEALKEGRIKDVKGVPTSQATAKLAQSVGIPLVDLGHGVDLAIDGIDEVTDALDATKGAGGALLREKVVEARATTLILVGDASKRVSRLGENFPIPVEVLQFGSEAAARDLEKLGCRAVLRERGGAPFLSDNGNYVIDCRFETAFDPATVGSAINNVPGVLEHGLFLGLASLVLIASEEGIVTLERP